MRNKFKRLLTKKRIMTLSLVLVVFVMSLGYAALSQYMELEGMAKIDTTWDVKIVDVAVSTTGEGEDIGHTYAGNTITTHSNIPTSVSSVTYTITVENQGNIIAKLNHIEKIIDDNASITYSISGVEAGTTILEPGSTNTITLKINYASGTVNASDITKDIMLTFHYVANTSTSGGDSGGSTTTATLVMSENIDCDEYGCYHYSYPSDSTRSNYLAGPIERVKIESVEFAISNNVPDNAIGSWDVSTTGDGQIMAWYTDTNSNNLYEVVIGQNGGVIANPNSSFLFSNLDKAVTIDLANLNTTNVTDMSYMFQGLNSLTTLDLEPLNTSSVTNMEAMFSYYRSALKLDLSSLDTAKVTNMSNMFYSYSSTSTLVLSSLDTSKVTDMSYMFSSYISTSALDLSPLDTSNVTNMSSMFSSYSSTSTLDLSSLDTANVTDMSGMFSGYSGTSALDLSSLDTANVTDMSYMFHHANVESINLSGWDTSKVTNMSNMFASCENLKSLDLSHFVTTKVSDISNMFFYCKALTTLDLSNFAPQNLTSMFMMFYGCTSLESVDISNINTSKVTKLDRIFSGCTNLKTVKFNNLNTSSVTGGDNEWSGISLMFSGCGQLTSIDLSNATLTDNAIGLNVFGSVPSGVTITVKGQSEKTWILRKLSTANVVIA